MKFGAFDLPRRRGAATSPLVAVVMSVGAAAMAIMKPAPTDIDPLLLHRWRNLLPLTGLELPAPSYPVPSTRWIIDGTLIPVHDQSITAISKNYRRSVNTLIIICAYRRRMILAGQCWPGNRNDVIVARATVAHLLNGRQEILGDGGYRGITPITTPRRAHTGRIIRDDHYRAHRRIRARVEHVIARLKDWQIVRQCRRRGHAINHSSTSSPDSGTSIPTRHYGSTL